MSLRDFPTAVWEILFSMLQTRHQARLAVTGDVRIKQALMQTWRSVNLLLLNDELVQEHDCLIDSALVRETLVKYARELTIDAGNFSNLLTAHLPLLVSLTIEPCNNNVDNDIEIFRLNLHVASALAGRTEVTLDLAKLAPNLESFRFDCGMIDYRVLLPSTLESLEFTVDGVKVISRFENLSQLCNLTTLVMDVRNNSLTLYDGIKWPPHLTRLALDLVDGDLPFIHTLPPTLRHLRVINVTSTSLCTGQFSHLPLVELSIRDWSHPHFQSYLNDVPPTLTSLELDALTMREDGALLDALKSLPPTLTRISVDSISTANVGDETMKRHLNLLLPRMGVAELDHLASVHVEDNHTPKPGVLFDALVGELHKRGPDAVVCAQKLALLSDFFRAKQAKCLHEAMQRALTSTTVPWCATKAAFQAYWQSAALPMVRYHASNETSVITSVIEGAVVLEVTQDEYSAPPDSLADKLTCVVVVSLSPDNIGTFFSRRLCNLSSIIVNSYKCGDEYALSIATAILKQHAHLPQLEAVHLEVSENIDPACEQRLHQCMAAMRLYPTKTRGEFRLRVSPPLNVPRPVRIPGVIKVYDW